MSNISVFIIGLVCYYALWAFGNWTWVLPFHEWDAATRVYFAVNAPLIAFIFVCIYNLCESEHKL